MQCTRDRSMPDRCAPTADSAYQRLQWGPFCRKAIRLSSASCMLKDRTVNAVSRYSEHPEVSCKITKKTNENSPTGVSVSVTRPDYASMAGGIAAGDGGYLKGQYILWDPNKPRDQLQRDLFQRVANDVIQSDRNVVPNTLVERVQENFGIFFDVDMTHRVLTAHQIKAQFTPTLVKACLESLGLRWARVTLAEAPDQNLGEGKVKSGIHVHIRDGISKEDLDTSPESAPRLLIDHENMSRLRHVVIGSLKLAHGDIEVEGKNKGWHEVVDKTVYGKPGKPGQSGLRILFSQKHKDCGVCREHEQRVKQECQTCGGNEVSLRQLCATCKRNAVLESSKDERHSQFPAVCFRQPPPAKARHQNSILHFSRCYSPTEMWNCTLDDTGNFESTSVLPPGETEHWPRVNDRDQETVTLLDPMTAWQRGTPDRIVRALELCTISYFGRDSSSLLQTATDPSWFTPELKRAVESGDNTKKRRNQGTDEGQAGGGGAQRARERDADADWTLCDQTDTQWLNGILTTHKRQLQLLNDSNLETYQTRSLDPSTFLCKPVRRNEHEYRVRLSSLWCPHKNNGRGGEHNGNGSYFSFKKNYDGSATVARSCFDDECQRYRERQAREFNIRRLCGSFSFNQRGGEEEVDQGARVQDADAGDATRTEHDDLDSRLGIDLRDKDGYYNLQSDRGRHLKKNYIHDIICTSDPERCMCPEHSILREHLKYDTFMLSKRVTGAGKNKVGMSYVDFLSNLRISELGDDTSNDGRNGQGHAEGDDINMGDAASSAASCGTSKVWMDKLISETLHSDYYNFSCYEDMMARFKIHGDDIMNDRKVIPKYRTPFCTFHNNGDEVRYFSNLTKCTEEYAYWSRMHPFHQLVLSSE